MRRHLTRYLYLASRPRGPDLSQRRISKKNGSVSYDEADFFLDVGARASGLKMAQAPQRDIGPCQWDLERACFLVVIQEKRSQMRSLHMASPALK